MIKVLIYEDNPQLREGLTMLIDGIEGLKNIRATNDQVKILMLTVFDDNKNVFESIKNGANGYILKKTAPQDCLSIYLKQPVAEPL